jgi:transposase
MLSPYIDTEIMNIFLEQFARQLAPDIQVVLIWDQAGFHTAHHLRLPGNITVLPLPPYSPELNPVENLWHYLRSHHWANREYEDYDALSDAACEAWQAVCLNPEIIRSVCHTPYLKLETRSIDL